MVVAAVMHEAANWISVVSTRVPGSESGSELTSTWPPSSSASTCAERGTNRWVSSGSLAAISTDILR